MEHYFTRSTEAWHSNSYCRPATQTLWVAVFLTKILVNEHLPALHLGDRSSELCTQNAHLRSQVTHLMSQLFAFGLHCGHFELQCRHLRWHDTVCGRDCKAPLRLGRCRRSWPKRAVRLRRVRRRRGVDVWRDSQRLRRHRGFARRVESAVARWRKWELDENLLVLVAYLDEQVDFFHVEWNERHQLHRVRVRVVRQPCRKPKVDFAAVSKQLPPR